MTPTNTPDDAAVESTGVEAPAAPRRRRATRAATAPTPVEAPAAENASTEGAASGTTVEPAADAPAEAERPART
ncbi:hypothetical protein, partial [Cellulomonas massiliensis]|uniref:hypothetical protein n=1 Tax=Cellulomonas massiliensis TaxID=1465811 RepID=UPI00037C5FBD